MTSKIITIGLLIGFCIGSTVLAKEVERVPLYSGKDAVHSVTIAGGSACSFKFPVDVQNIILGNGNKFKAIAVANSIVSLKALTSGNNLFTNLQVVLTDKRIVTINVKTGSLQDSTSQITFYEDEAGKVEKELQKKARALESRYREKEKTLEERFHDTEKMNFMRDMLYAYRHKEVRGGRVNRGIGLYPKEYTIRDNDLVFLKIEVQNRTDDPYKIANLEVIERHESGLFKRGTKKEKPVRSSILCTNDGLGVPANSKEECVVSFVRPERKTGREQVALRLSESSNKARNVFIRRILEIYR